MKQSDVSDQRSENDNGPPPAPQPWTLNPRPNISPRHVRILGPLDPSRRSVPFDRQIADAHNAQTSPPLPSFRARPGERTSMPSSLCTRFRPEIPMAFALTAFAAALLFLGPRAAHAQTDPDTNILIILVDDNAE